MMNSSKENDVKPTILLAEDDKLSSSYFKAVLSSQGFNVIIAENGVEAVSVVREHPEVMLVLMDIKMPEKSGIEAAREIRSFNESIPLIAQTAFALAGDREAIMESGFNDYITKPVSKEDLIAVVNRFL
ncbi:response regulator [Marinilabilia sp.]|uniref:response regulator n=1 Tax=Marinilabilia sp. TaxID=2021252 RepID=UPI0025BECE96|nr:response regulator [Marinilabilia sp.]